MFLAVRGEGPRVHTGLSHIVFAPRSNMILAGDIGGTKVNLAFFEVTGQQLTQRAAATYSSRQHTSLDEIVREFLSTNNLKADYACFGIAGPVKKGRAQL